MAEGGRLLGPLALEVAPSRCAPLVVVFETGRPYLSRVTPLVVSAEVALFISLADKLEGAASAEVEEPALVPGGGP